MSRWSAEDLEAVALALNNRPLEYIDWYNNRRLHGSIGHLAPAEAEAAYYRQHQPTPAGAVN